MLLYRTIEFSRFSFLIDNDHQNLFRYCVNDYEKNNPIGNFWFDNKYKTEKNAIVKNVVDRQDDFFSMSLDFNSKIGGRFNPSRSFGSLYCSSSPTLATLESLYHVFEGSRKVFQELKRSSDKLTNNFNIHIPDCIQSLFISFEIEIDNTIKIHDLCKSNDALRTICSQIGFDRYIDKKSFNSDFIFGNDLEITNIIGCHFHNNADSSIKYPSARLELGSPAYNYLYNLSIPEKDMYKLKPKLTGNIREYETKTYLKESVDGYSIDIIETGSVKKTYKILLQQWPMKKNKKQIHVYTQKSGTPKDNEKYSRTVKTQKYIL